MKYQLIKKHTVLVAFCHVISVQLKKIHFCYRAYYKIVILKVVETYVPYLYRDCFLIISRAIISFKFYKLENIFAFLGNSMMCVYIYVLLLYEMHELNVQCSRLTKFLFLIENFQVVNV